MFNGLFFFYNIAHIFVHIVSTGYIYLMLFIVLRSVTFFLSVLSQCAFFFFFFFFCAICYFPFRSVLYSWINRGYQDGVVALDGYRLYLLQHLHSKSRPICWVSYTVPDLEKYDRRIIIS